MAAQLTNQNDHWSFAANIKGLEFTAEMQERVPGVKLKVWHEYSAVNDVWMMIVLCWNKDQTDNTIMQEPLTCFPSTNLMNKLRLLLQ